MSALQTAHLEGMSDLDIHVYLSGEVYSAEALELIESALSEAML